jgi:hypothetical protein
VHEVLRSSGRPLDAAPRTELETQLGHDLGRVRIHTDPRAAASARAVGARAYAVGRHVVFDTGAYAPATTEGRQRLVHEVVHTLQQGLAAPGPAGTLRLSGPQAASEREADALGRAGPRPAMAPVPVTPAPLQLAAQPAPGGSVARWRLETATRLLQQASGGPALLNGLVESQTVIELRLAAGGSAFFRVRNPLKQTDRHTWVRDDHTFVVDELKSAPAGASPRVLLDETQSLGDLALNLFRGRQQARWAAHDPATLAASVQSDDRAAARADYVRTMVGNVAHRNVEQLALKLELEQLGAEVKTALPFEGAFRRARTQAFLGEMSRSANAAAASRAATTAGYRTIEQTLETGAALTHEGATYATHFGQAWDRELLAWTAREPRKAAEGQVRHATDRMVKTMVALVNQADPRDRRAHTVITAIEHFARQYGGAARIQFMAGASAGLERLLGPFGYRTVYGSDIARLMHQRLDYALANYLALLPHDRQRVLEQPALAARFGIRQDRTDEEMAAENRLVSLRVLPDGTPHTGTRQEFDAALEAQRIQHALDQINQIRTAGPISLAGRAVGGEKGAAIGALGDAALAVRSPRALRRQRQAAARSSSSGSTPPRTAPLEPIAHRAPAPARQPLPAPRPTQLTETEVVAANVRHRSALQVQTPDVHQANWVRFGGEGPAPTAYRHAGTTVYLSSDSWLVAPATRAGIPPVRPGPGAPVPTTTPTPPAPTAVRPSAPARSHADIAFEQTGQPDPFAQTPPAPAPAPGRPAPSRVTPASGPRPRSRFNPELPPQPVSAARVQQLSHLARFTVDAARHQQAWELLGGRGAAPAAFISEKVIYLDPTRWPRS